LAPPHEAGTTPSRPNAPEGAALTKRTPSGAIALGRVELDAFDVTGLRALFAAAIDEVWNTSAHDARMAQEASERTKPARVRRTIRHERRGALDEEHQLTATALPSAARIRTISAMASPGAGHQRHPSRAPAIPSDVFGDGTG